MAAPALVTTKRDPYGKLFVGEMLLLALATVVSVGTAAWAAGLRGLRLGVSVLPVAALPVLLGLSAVGGRPRDAAPPWAPP